MAPYDQETEQTMKRFYNTLSEKDRRRYAGSEALRYGPGGRSYIAQVLGCSRRTVSEAPKRSVSSPVLKWIDVFVVLERAANPTRSSGLTSTTVFYTSCRITPLVIRWTTRFAGPT